MAPLCAVLQNVIRTLVRRNSAQCTKEWVNTSWQLVLSDEVGSHCSWTCVRDLRITLAIRTAFVRKLGRDEVFMEKTQLFFRYC
ncbi:hypothetical protein ACLKA7_012386 [Drosophila subpalustris]